MVSSAVKLKENFLKMVKEELAMLFLCSETTPETYLINNKVEGIF